MRCVAELKEASVDRLSWKERRTGDWRGRQGQTPQGTVDLHLSSSDSLFMHIYMYMCTHIHVYTCIYTYMRIYTYTRHMCMCVCVRERARASVCVWFNHHHQTAKLPSRTYAPVYSLALDVSVNFTSSSATFTIFFFYLQHLISKKYIIEVFL